MVNVTFLELSRIIQVSWDRILELERRYRTVVGAFDKAVEKIAEIRRELYEARNLVKAYKIGATRTRKILDGVREQLAGAQGAIEEKVHALMDLNHTLALTINRHRSIANASTRVAAIRTDNQIRRAIRLRAVREALNRVWVDSPTHITSYAIAIEKAVDDLDRIQQDTQ